MRRINRLAGTALGAGFFLLCSSASAQDRNGEILAPEQFSGLVSHERSPEAWWSGLGDSELTQLVGQALDGNFGLRALEDQQRMAHALSRQVAAPALPMVSLDLSQQAQPCAETGLAICELVALQAGEEAPDTYTQSSRMLSASMGLDVWGEQILQVRSARLEAAALAGDQESLSLWVSSQIADALFGLRHARALSALMAEQVQATRDLLLLTETRFARTEASALDVLQQRQQLASIQAQLPAIELQIQLSQSRLRALIGGGDLPALDAQAPLPSLEASPGLGAPSELIESRPDVRAAWTRYQAALRRERAAWRAGLPDLGVSAQVGKTHVEILEKETEETWAVGASLSVPIFMGGSTVSASQAARAESDALFRATQQALWDAVSEVESAALLDHALAAQRDALQVQVAAAELAYTEALHQYEAGLGSTLQVLTSQATLITSKSALLQTHRDHLSARTQVMTALGTPAGTQP